MFCTPRTLKTAKKNHRCTYCGDPIISGDKYYSWVSIDDGKFFRSKMHPECVDGLDVDYEGENTYHPYYNERLTGVDKFSDMVKYLIAL